MGVGRPSSQSFLFRSAGLAALSLAYTTAVQAQSEQTGKAAVKESTTSPSRASQAADGDIVVTATRRSERLDKVGLSITALSSGQLQTLGVKNSTEVMLHTPGAILETTGGAGLLGNFTVRGVANTDVNPNQESPNPIYLDDIYVSSPYESSIPVYDLDRAEVLRGPQGTLFGRNSTGGLANFISKRPTDQFDGFIHFTKGSFDQTRVEAAVGGPVDENTRFRLSGLMDRFNGWWKNYSGHDTNASRHFALRGQLDHDFNSDFKVHLQMDYDRDPRTRSSTYKTINAYISPDTGQPISLPANVDAYGTGPGNDRVGYRDPYSAFKGSFNDFGFLRKTRLSPTVKLDWRLSDSLSVTSLTNYTYFNMDYLEESDGTPVDLLRYTAAQKLKQWSEELRLSYSKDSLNLTAGLYYLSIDQNDLVGFKEPAYSGTPFAFDLTNPFHQFVRSYSVFGQAEYSVTDKLKLTLGGRIIHDLKTFHSVVQFAELGNGVTGTAYNPPLVTYEFSHATVGSLATEKKWMWSGRVQADYQIDPDTLIYAGFSRGVKGPGFNSNSGGTTSLQDTPFKAETLLAYEAGTKLKLFNHRVRLNLSAFYYDYKNFQAFAFSGVTSKVSNNDARMYGGEAELSASPGAGFSLALGAAYLRSRVYDVNTVYSGVRDQEAVNAPRWSLTGSIVKDIRIGDNTLMFVYDANYVSTRYSSVDNNWATQMNHAIIQNIRMSFKLQEHSLEFTVFAKNFTNKAKEIVAFDALSTIGSKSVVYSPPRWIGGEIRYDF